MDIEVVLMSEISTSGEQMKKFSYLLFMKDGVEEELGECNPEEYIEERTGGKVIHVSKYEDKIYGITRTGSVFVVQKDSN